MAEFIWHGKNLKTTGDLIDAVVACQSREEAQEFMRAYRAISPYARENIGYMAGYLSREQATRVFEWFEVSHPVFGTTFPTAEEAFKAGLKMGELSQKYGSKKAMQMLGYTTADSPWHVGISDILGDFTRN